MMQSLKDNIRLLFLAIVFSLSFPAVAEFPYEFSVSEESGCETVKKALRKYPLWTMIYEGDVGIWGSFHYTDTVVFSEVGNGWSAHIKGVRDGGGGAAFSGSPASVDFISPITLNANALSLNTNAGTSDQITMTLQKDCTFKGSGTFFDRATVSYKVALTPAHTGAGDK